MILSASNRVACLLLLVACGGCLGDAPHSNPLDPNADEFEEVGALSGTTTRFYPPFAPVESAEVRLTPGPFVAVSRGDGSFAFDALPVGTYQLEATQDGLSSRTRTVDVELGVLIDTLQVRMNGLPMLQDVAFRTTRISRWYPPDDLLLLEAETVVDDRDGLGDVSRVWFETAASVSTFELAPKETAGTYGASFPADSLPGRSLYSLEGAEMYVHARDEAGFETSSGPYFFVRVIDYTPLAQEPQGQENVGTGTPTFTWQDAALPYDFTYRIDIVRDQANVQTVVRTVEGIDAERTSYASETPLPSGTYFWTVSVVDSHGNRSRSKEAGFIVPQ